MPDAPAQASPPPLSAEGDEPPDALAVALRAAREAPVADDAGATALAENLAGSAPKD